MRLQPSGADSIPTRKSSHRRSEMTRYWVVALIAAVVVLLFVVRRITRPPETDGDAHAAEALPDEQSVDCGDLDDTAPAVLSPPEWKPPKSVSNGQHR
jgi:hypothetical protein